MGVPFRVDFKEGGRATKALFKKNSNRKTKEEQISWTKALKKAHGIYKSKGGKKSFNQWGLHNGYLKRHNSQFRKWLPFIK